MNIATIAEEIVAAYSKIFLFFYRRRDPRGYRPSPETLAVLEHLFASGPLTVSEAAMHFDRSPSAMSEQLDRLVNRGLLDRISDERDRRRRLVWLSKKGQELLEEERQVLHIERLVKALEIMTPTERENLLDGLSALIRAAKKARRPESPNCKEKK
jgi:DNA-binding MarR family transcriptional regulator